MNTVCFVQARMGSTRLPGKVLLPLSGETVLSLLLRRLSLAKNINKIVVLIPCGPANKNLGAAVQELGHDVFYGSERNVLKRFFDANSAYKADAIVRITGDCPLIDPAIVDAVISQFRDGDCDYISNIDPPTFPDGMDVEVFSKFALTMAYRNASSDYEREHVTPYLRKKKIFKCRNFAGDNDRSDIRLTLDEKSDYELISNIVEHFQPAIDFSLSDVLEYIDEQGNTLLSINNQIIRNQGSIMSSGQKLWQRAKKVIPAGNMLLSKRPEMFLPEQWPVYFSKTEGAKVWDLDGNCFLDISLMGVGTNSLGYSHPEVDAAVKRTIDKGNMSTLNAPEEVFLAEKLIDIHNFAEMARFCRTGGEANAVAIRIARAATGREKVAFCGYHGWHDWYLAANLSDDDRLVGHLLPGLEPNGVAKSLADTVFTFEYNQIEQLKKLVNEHDLAAIKMEVVRNEEPNNNFLKEVRELATKNGIVLIFDECTSGFRETYGGIHKKYGIEPDMAVFGKALGNGYAITAIIGRRSVMDAANSSFISSTFWSERIGYSAALATLEVMEREKSWEYISDFGLYVRNRWKEIAEQHSVEINTFGIPAIGGFSFKSDNSFAYKTLISQEMLQNGILAGNSIYACLSHNYQMLDRYFEVLDEVFETIKSCEDGANISDFLRGPICHSGFRRLN